MAAFKKPDNAAVPEPDPANPPLLEVLDVLGLMPEISKIGAAPATGAGSTSRRTRRVPGLLLREDAHQLREKNDLLAAALGACAECWGATPDCIACQGQGRPGFFPPDIACFTHFVLPALRRAQSGDLGNILSEMVLRSRQSVRRGATGLDG